MIDKPVDKITRGDIEALVADEAREGRRLDYKEELPGGRGKDKKKSLADVSSFANAAGGLIIYGVSEKRDDSGQPTGIPEKALGLAGVNVDKVRLQFENSIRDGISPRIPGIRIEAVEGFPEGPVLLLSIPRSWAAPHMVTYKGASRFYSRTSAGKHQLDVGEIRAAFEASAGLGERIMRFRDERLGRITASETPLPLADGVAVVLHVLPIASFGTGASIDMTDVSGLWNRLPPLGKGSFNYQRNFDGLLTHYSEPGSGCLAYAQLFRNGAVEGVCADFSSKDRNDVLWLGPYYEVKVIEALSAYLSVQQSLGLEPPVFAFLSLLGTRGYLMAASFHISHLGKPIGRESLVLPGVEVESHSADLQSLLKPEFDTVWQASGFAASQNYDKNGDWNPRR